MWKIKFKTVVTHIPMKKSCSFKIGLIGWLIWRKEQSITIFFLIICPDKEDIKKDKLKYQNRQKMVTLLGQTYYFLLILW